MISDKPCKIPRSDLDERISVCLKQSLLFLIYGEINYHIQKLLPADLMSLKSIDTVVGEKSVNFPVELPPPNATK